MNESESNSSIIMDLENLNQQYSNLLIKYKSAVADYVSYLNVQRDNQELVSIKGQSFIGTGSAGQSSATTLQDCMASCANSNTCTGATFISNTCEIRTGDSPIVPSSENSYAIIPRGKQLLLDMENINQQLLDVNNQLVEKIQISEPVFDEKSNEAALKNKELIQNYENLMEEREKIVKIINEYETLDNTDDENQIKISQNYYSYILLLILAVLAIILLYNMFGSGTTNTIQQVQYGGELGINAYYIVFGLIIFVIILNYSIKYLNI